MSDIFKLIWRAVVELFRSRASLEVEPTSSPTLAAGRLHRDTSSAIGTGSTARYSPGVFARWAFVTGRVRRDRHGRMDILNG
jgi:hypothetical protein